ncbi:hypothetical protein [Aquimarina celericrescens]|uniref:Secreted protein n=1 Tax=Aquimarina celericrescens TaxID=1964542 RepID=A0ABW5B054_9FLAO|nr:hypothetical protein [Aquimarina celericrescens]
MRNVPFYLKAIFLFLTVALFASCESESVNEEIGINEQETFETYQIDKEDVVPPGDRD